MMNERSSVRLLIRVWRRSGPSQRPEGAISLAELRDQWGAAADDTMATVANPVAGPDFSVPLSRWADDSAQATFFEFSYFVPPTLADWVEQHPTFVRQGDDPARPDRERDQIFDLGAAEEIGPGVLLIEED